jgi:hypothetical protein
MPLPVNLVREGRLLVAVPVTKVPPLTFEIVQATVDAIRSERGASA